MAEHYSMNVDVVYSPDEGGWYAESYRFDPSRQTALCRTRGEAIAAARRGEWED